MMFRGRSNIFTATSLIFLYVTMWICNFEVYCTSLDTGRSKQPTSKRAPEQRSCAMDAALRRSVVRRLRTISKKMLSDEEVVLTPEEAREAESRRAVLQVQLQALVTQLDERRKLSFNRNEVTRPMCSGKKCKGSLEKDLYLLLTVLVVESAPPREHGFLRKKFQGPLEPLLRANELLPFALVVPADVAHKAKDQERGVWVAQRPLFATPGRLLNALAERARTPYVLVARDASHIDGSARLKQLVHLSKELESLGMLEVGAVVGGAVRDAWGHWSHGCYQTSRRHHRLRVRRGYHFSARDCMLCDHLRGPFVAPKDLVRKVPFSERLRGEALFTDWFLRLKRQHVTVLSCPDAMFFVSGHVDDEETTKEKKSDQNVSTEHADIFSVWRDFSRMWHVDEIIRPEKPPLLFTCQEVSMECGLEWRGLGAGLPLPRCCLDDALAALRAMDELAQREGVHYELAGTSVLGAVAMRTLAPSPRSHATVALLEPRKGRAQDLRSKERTSDNSLLINFISCNRSPHITINVTTVPSLRQPEDFPTRVNVMGLWLRAPPNPGSYSRKLFGKGFLRHATFHLNVKGRDSSGNDFVLIP